MKQQGDRRVTRRGLLQGCLPAVAGLALARESRAAAGGTVTLEADRLSLVELAAELTRQTGIPHRTSGAEAKQQRIVLFCRDQSAASVRKAVSDLLGWTWSESSGPGEKTYTLVKGLNQRKREAALRARFQEDYAGFFRELVAHAGPRDPDQPRDGYANMLVSPTSKALFAGLASFTAPQFQALFTSRGFGGTLQNLAPEIRRMADGVLAAENGIPRRGPRTVLQPTDILRLEVARDSCGRPESLQFSTYREGRLELQFNAGHVVQAEALGRSFGVEPRPPRSPQLLRDRQFLAPLPFRPPLEWPKPPAKEPSQIGWQVQALSRHTPLPWIADCYPEMEAVTFPFKESRRPYAVPKVDGLSLRKVLDRLEDELPYDWDFRDSWVMLRYRHWYWEPLRKPAS